MSKAHTRRDFVAFVLWKEILNWKAFEANEGRRERSKLQYPYAYGSRMAKLGQARPGDVLWVITAPKFGPVVSAQSLVGRLEVECAVGPQSSCAAWRRVPQYIREQGWPYVVIGAPKRSCYLPINDAYDLLCELFPPRRSKAAARRIPRRQRLKSGMYGLLSQRFRTLRELPQPDGALRPAYEKLEDHAKNVRRGRSVFISYVRREASSTVGELIDRLAGKSINCWVDVSNLPAPVSKGRVLIDKKKMAAAVKDAIRQSTLFIALVTKSYQDRGWTQLEWAEAETQCVERRRAQGFRRIQIDMGGDIVNDDVVPWTDVDRVATQLQRRLPRK